MYGINYIEEIFYNSYFSINRFLIRCILKQNKYFNQQRDTSKQRHLVRKLWSQQEFGVAYIRH